MPAPANMLSSPPLPAVAIFSSGGMLEAAMTAESERVMKGLTLCSRNLVKHSRVLACGKSVLKREKLQEKTNCIAQRLRASNPIPHVKTP